MIRNYNELLICIEKVEKQICQLKKKQLYLVYKLNFTEVDQLVSKQQLLELQILSYIEYYQEKIKNNYLENKLYTSELSSLKIKYQPKTIANDLLNSIKELYTEYENLNRFGDVLAIKEKKEDIINKMKITYVELRNILLSSNSKINENKTPYYRSAIDYFQENNATKIKDLKNKELYHKKSVLESFKLFFIFKISKKIRMEINKIKTKLDLIIANNKSFYNE